MAAAFIRGWELVIGLELHAQLRTATKLMSSAPVISGCASLNRLPNVDVQSCDVALPGSLPVVNRACVEQVARAGIALGGTVHRVSRFERKHYFYCDLPAGYQITQQDAPLVTDGNVRLDDGTCIRIERIQLEQDSGKSLHDVDPDATYLDFNRAGVGLAEIVTAPDLRTAAQACECVRKVQGILKYIDVCDGIMAHGSLRCDVNVSIRRPDWDPSNLGERVEVKNLNSLRAIENSIEHEYLRQIAVFEAGGSIERETRTFDAAAGHTIRLRRKEELLDYRFFPDPDLPAVILTEREIEEIRESIPELPDAIRDRLVADYHLDAYDARVLSADPATVSYFEAVVHEGPDCCVEWAKSSANWIANELFSLLHQRDFSIDQSPLSSHQLASLIQMVVEKSISGKVAKKVFLIMFQGDDRLAKAIVDEQGWGQISDENLLFEMCRKVVADHPTEVEAIRRGRTRRLNHLKSVIMKQTKGQANPALTDQLLQRVIRGLETSGTDQTNCSL